MLNNGANISATSDVSTLIFTSKNIYLLLVHVNNDNGNAH